MSTSEAEPKPRGRGTSNGNHRGNNVTRRQRKLWLLANYPADVKMLRVTYIDGTEEVVQPETFQIPTEALGTWPEIGFVEEVDTCRCYRCGKLLWFETMTVDCIKPRILGGRYGTPRQDTREGRTNVRPACDVCNPQTGGGLANGKKHRAAKARAKRRADG